MPFHDLLNAIVSQTDADIARLKDEHIRRLDALKQETKNWITQREQDFVTRAGERKTELLAKAEAHAFQERRRKVTQYKRDLLDAVYQKTVAALTALPAPKTEQLLRNILESIPGTGVIHPTAAHRSILKKLVSDARFTLGEDTAGSGGFLFRGEREERDCTYESLVKNTVRPRTEMHALKIAEILAAGQGPVPVFVSGWMLKCIATVGTRSVVRPMETLSMNHSTLMPGIHSVT